MAGSDDVALHEIRLDKWLWAARFFKTRQLAAEAIDGGHIHVNGQRAKPSKTIRTGCRIEITKNQLKWDITVVAVSTQRRPAQEAQTLYAEEEHHREQRQAQAAQRRAENLSGLASGKPTKRDRRLIHRFKHGPL